MNLCVRERVGMFGPWVACMMQGVVRVVGVLGDIVLLLGKLGTMGGVWFVWRMFFFATGWYVATLMEYVAMLQELQGRN